jgi:hypothetical protein
METSPGTTGSLPTTTLNLLALVDSLRPQNIYYAAAKQGQPSASGHNDHTQYPLLKRNVSTISLDLCQNHLTLQNSSKSQSSTLRSVPVRVHVPTTGATGWLLPCLYLEFGTAWCCPGGVFFLHYIYTYGGLGDLELRAFGVCLSFTTKTVTKTTTKTTFLCHLAYGLNSLPPLWL